ncbi:hypothetical protein ACO0LF_19465 [Undibacterium sp. Di27W]|uniref:hypothetical protein n=1 Tax=Undibacterium sp. Di27W TaxID=3413036 RepID=UPI003BF14209
MINKSILIATAIIASTASAVWLLWPQTEDKQIPLQIAATSSSTAAPGKPAQQSTASWPPPFPERNDERKFVPLLATGPLLSAAQSLAATRDGDPRTPPIEHTQVTQEMPSAAELADSKAYQQYEARQNTRLYAAYVQAADEEIPRLRAAIARAHDMGMAAADIAKGEEKLRRITAMQGQLLNEHPELQNGNVTKTNLK